MQIQIALAGALPALGAMYWFDRLDAKRPEPRWSLRKVAIAGGVSTLPVIFAEAILAKLGPEEGSYAAALWMAFVVAAATEELAKVLCVRLFVWNRPEFDERMDGITYAVRAGLGFALVENVLYLLKPATAGAFLLMFAMRAVLAVPGHAIWAGMMGHFAARRRFDKSGPGLLGGYLVAVFLHGAYDAGIFCAIVASAMGDTALVIPCLATPLAVIVGGGIWLRRMARRDAALDDHHHAQLAAQAAAAAAGPPGPYGHGG